MNHEVLKPHQTNIFHGCKVSGSLKSHDRESSCREHDLALNLVAV